MKRFFLPVLSASVILTVFFTSCNQTASATEMTEDGTHQSISSDIAYVNIDTLLFYYDMYTDLAGSFQEKSSRAESDLTSRGRSLERDVVDFQDKTQKGLVTRSQAQTMEEDLQRKQQNFLQHRDNILSQLEEEQMVMMNRIHYSIMDFLEDYNKDGRYGMILSTSSAGPILAADKSLDITREVLDGINKYYADNKDKE